MGEDSTYSKKTVNSDFFATNVHSSCCRAVKWHAWDCPRSVRTAIGGKDNLMTRKENQSKKFEEGICNYPHPIYVPIEDGDEASIKHYKNSDVPVGHFALKGQKQKHYYAIYPAETQDIADQMNRTYNNWSKKNERDRKAQSEHECSYEALLEDGYDPKDDANNTEEIVAHKVVLNALVSEMDRLTDEKIRLCRMVANKESQRKVAEELNMPRRTLRDKKDKMLSELAETMKYYQ